MTPVHPHKSFLIDPLLPSVPPTPYPYPHPLRQRDKMARFKAEDQAKRTAMKRKYFASEAAPSADFQAKLEAAGDIKPVKESWRGGLQLNGGAGSKPLPPVSSAPKHVRFGEDGQPLPGPPPAAAGGAAGAGPEGAAAAAPKSNKSAAQQLRDRMKGGAGGAAAASDNGEQQQQEEDGPKGLNGPAPLQAPVVKEEQDDDQVRPLAAGNDSRAGPQLLLVIRVQHYGQCYAQSHPFDALVFCCVSCSVQHVQVAALTPLPLRIPQSQKTCSSYPLTLHTHPLHPACFPHSPGQTARSSAWWAPLMWQMRPPDLGQQRRQQQLSSRRRRAPHLAASAPCLMTW
jgi:hypothetical protein